MSAQEIVVTKAKSYEGYLEKATNSNLNSFTGNAGKNNFTKFAEELSKTNLLNGNKNGYEWCAVFYIAIFYECYGEAKTKEALYLPNRSLAAGCYYAVQYYKNVGKFGTIPQVGAQIFFKDGDGEPCHTGMVTAFDNTYVWTIEGNTSSTTSETVISNGGGVFQRKYSRSNSKIYGYGYPNWSVLESYTEGWQKSNNKWWYRYTDGSYPKNEWKEIDGYWYYFDEEGYILTDVSWEYNGVIYIADENGHVTSKENSNTNNASQEQERIELSSVKVFGIDVSAWQGNFNLSKAKASEGIKFVVLKAGGADDGYYKDSKFESFYQSAKSIGLNVGAYFFSKALDVASAKKEAEYFYNNCLKGKQFELPVYLDVENKTQLGIGKANLTKVIKTWCEAIKSYGFLPGIYSSLSYFSSYMNDNELQEYEHWVAQWSTSCQYSGCGLWQFGGETNYIRSNKINGQVIDQDYMLKDYPTFIKENGLNGYEKKTYEEGWQKTDGKWWYRYSDGTYPISQWAMIDNKWYYFDSEGYMVSNEWRTGSSDGKMYYLGSDGAMVINKTVIIDENGALVPNGNFYHLIKEVIYSVYKNTLDKLISKGILKGKGGSGENLIIDLSEEAVRLLVIQDRAGLFD